MYKVTCLKLVLCPNPNNNLAYPGSCQSAVVNTDVKDDVVPTPEVQPHGVNLRGRVFPVHHHARAKVVVLDGSFSWGKMKTTILQ